MIEYFIGAAVLLQKRKQPEPMSYSSVADYNFWRLYMYDHFEE